MTAKTGKTLPQSPLFLASTLEKEAIPLGEIAQWIYDITALREIASSFLGTKKGIGKYVVATKDGPIKTVFVNTLLLSDDQKTLFSAAGSTYICEYVYTLNIGEESKIIRLADLPEKQKPYDKSEAGEY